MRGIINQIVRDTYKEKQEEEQEKARLALIREYEEKAAEKALERLSSKLLGDCIDKFYESELVRI